MDTGTQAEAFREGVFHLLDECIYAFGATTVHYAGRTDGRCASAGQLATKKPTADYSPLAQSDYLYPPDDIVSQCLGIKVATSLSPCLDVFTLNEDGTSAMICLRNNGISFCCIR